MIPRGGADSSASNSSNMYNLAKKKKKKFYTMNDPADDPSRASPAPSVRNNSRLSRYNDFDSRGDEDSLSNIDPFSPRADLVAKDPPFRGDTGTTAAAAAAAAAAASSSRERRPYRQPITLRKMPLGDRGGRLIPLQKPANLQPSSYASYLPESTPTPGGFGGRAGAGSRAEGEGRPLASKSGLELRTGPKSRPSSVLANDEGAVECSGASPRNPDLRPLRRGTRTPADFRTFPDSYL